MSAVKSWALTRNLLTKLLREHVVKYYNYDPLVEVHEVTAGEFRVRVNNADERIGPRYFRVKVIEEK